MNGPFGGAEPGPRSMVSAVGGDLGSDGEIRPRGGPHADDGLPERAPRGVLQLHPRGLLVLPPRVPGPRRPREARRARAANPRAVRAAEGRGLPRAREGAGRRRRRGPERRRPLDRRGHGGRRPPHDGPSGSWPGLDVVHDGRDPHAVHEGEIPRTRGESPETGAEVQGRRRRARGVAVRLPGGDAGVPRNRPHRPRGDGPLRPGHPGPGRRGRRTARDAVHERDGPNTRAGGQDPSPCGTVSAAVTTPGLIRDLSEIIRARPEKWVGIQSGIETGSPKVSREVLHRKAAPFSAEEWPDIVVQATEILTRNYWFPAYTIILGLPGETPEDAWMTVDLIDRMEQIADAHFITAPLTFVPIGALRGEECYNLDEQIDAARFNVAYRAWRHIILEIDHDLWRLTKLPLPVEAMIIATDHISLSFMLVMMHWYAP